MKSTITLEIREYLATVTLSNPDKLNAIDAGMWKQLRDVMHQINDDPDLRCVVIRGAGAKAFASGGDLEEFLSVRTTVEDALHYHEDCVANALNCIRNCPIPTIAAIRGPCIGGGLEIAACCDLRIAGEGARFGAPINRLGFSMYPGELAGLLDLVGAAVVLEILLEGRILNAAEALQKGLLTRVVPDEAVFDETAATTRRILAGAPMVARWHKQWVRRLSSTTPLSDEEKRQAFAFLGSEDYKEGLAAFLEKRKPAFTGR